MTHNVSGGFWGVLGGIDYELAFSRTLNPPLMNSCPEPPPPLEEFVGRPLNVCISRATNHNSTDCISCNIIIFVLFFAPFFIGPITVTFMN